MRTFLSLITLISLLGHGTVRAAVVQVSPFGGGYPLNVSTDWYTTVGPETRVDAGGSFQYRETVEYLGFSPGGTFAGGYDLGPSLLGLQNIGPQTQWQTLTYQAQAVSVHKVTARPRPLEMGGGYDIADDLTQILTGRYAIRVTAADGVHYGWMQIGNSQLWNDFTAYRQTSLTVFLEQEPNTPVPVPEPAAATLSAVLAAAFCCRRRRR